jgi:hypothetical protein
VFRASSLKTLFVLSVCFVVVFGVVVSLVLIRIADSCQRIVHFIALTVVDN